MNGGIQRRLTVIISLCVLIPLSLVWFSARYLSNRATEQSARQRQAVLARLAASDFSQLVQRAENQLELFGSSLVRTADLLEITNDRLYPILLSSQIFSEIGIYDTEGTLMASAVQAPPSLLPFSLNGSPMLEQLSAGQNFYGGFDLETHQHGGPSSGQEAQRLRLAVPVEGLNDRRVFVVGDVDRQRLVEVIQTFSTATNATVLLVAPDGHIVLASEDLAQDASAQEQLAAFSADFDAADYTSLTGIDVVGARSTVEPLGTTLLLESPASEIYADVRSLSLNLLLVIALAIPLVVAVGRIAGGRIARPIKELHSGVERFTDDVNNFRPVEIHTRDELTALAEAFNATARRLSESHTELERSNERLELQVRERTATLEQLLHELQEKSTAQEELLETVRRLGLPVIPLMRGMLLMPLVGEINAERAGELGPRLLRAVEQERARVVLLDISGVPIVDIVVAQALVNAARAVRLVGADAILVGIRPEVSESLVSLDLPLNAMLTAATLEQGIALGSQLVRSKAPSNGRQTPVPGAALVE